VISAERHKADRFASHLLGEDVLRWELTKAKGALRTAYYTPGMR